MVTIEDETTIGGIINELKQNAGRTGVKKTELSSLLSSLGRIYKETTNPSKSWQDEPFEIANFEERLQEFAEKMQGRFKGKSTLSVYKARARKVVTLYNELSTVPQTVSPETTPQNTRSEDRTIYSQLRKLEKSSGSLKSIELPLSEEKNALLVIPSGDNTNNLKTIVRLLEMVINISERSKEDYEKEKRQNKLL